MRLFFFFLKKKHYLKYLFFLEFAVWDLAFHCVAIAEIDIDFAKAQLLLFTREWYMHADGSLPSYEWNFDDQNPTVHAWACYRVVN